MHYTLGDRSTEGEQKFYGEYDGNKKTTHYGRKNAYMSEVTQQRIGRATVKKKTKN